MQYLLKISIDNTDAWRLIAIDGQADLAHVAKLIALSLIMLMEKCCLTLKEKTTMQV